MLKFKHRILDKLVRLRTHQLKVLQGEEACKTQWQQDGQQQQGHGSLDGLLSALHIPPEMAGQTVDRSKFEAMGKQEFIALWKSFLSDASVCLLEIDGLEAQQRLPVLVARAIFIFKNMSLFNPDKLFQVGAGMRD